MTNDELKMLQALPLDIKVAKTKQRIHEAVRQFGLDGVYISFSGGKDSVVLLDIARSIYPDILAVFCDTGLEYPEVKEIVRNTENVEIIRPNQSFKEVLTKKGYPVVSKEISKYVHDITDGTEHMRNMRLYGQNGDPKRWTLPKKWHFLIDAPFTCSDRCCDTLKKYPFKSYENKTKRIRITGQMAYESRYRKWQYLKHGCNMFEENTPQSMPMGFWTEQDVYEYITQNNLKIADCYGDIEQVDGKYKTTGMDRTGCMFCTFGIMHEENPNRFQILKELHPDLYNYCIYGGEFDENGKWKPSSKGLGFSKILDYIKVPYE